MDLTIEFHFIPARLFSMMALRETEQDLLLSRQTARKMRANTLKTLTDGEDYVKTSGRMPSVWKGGAL
jgi:hypothetical protein